MSDFNNQLVKTVISTNPKEELAAIDVYAQRANGVINNIQSFASRFGVDLSNLVRGGKSVTAMIPRVVESVNRFNKGNLVERMAAVTSLSDRVLPNLPKGIQSSVESAIGQYGDYFSNVRDIVVAADGVDFTKINEVGNFINRFAGEGTVKLFDQDAVSGLVTGLIGEAKDVGIGNVFSAITENMDDPDLLLKIANGSIPLAIRTSDIDMLRDIGTALDTKNINTLFTDTLTRFASEFNINLAGLTRDSKELFTAINDTFNLLDPDWLADFRLEGLESILSGEVLGLASEDFKSIFMEGIRNESGSPMSNLDAVYITSLLEQNKMVNDAIRGPFPFRIEIMR